MCIRDRGYANVKHKSNGYQNRFKSKQYKVLRDVKILNIGNIYKTNKNVPSQITVPWSNKTATVITKEQQTNQAQIHHETMDQHDGLKCVLSKILQLSKTLVSVWN